MKLTEKLENLKIQSPEHFYKAKKFIEQLPNFFKGSLKEWSEFLNSINGKYFYTGFHFISQNEIAVELFMDKYNKESNSYEVVATKYIKFVNSEKEPCNNLDRFSVGLFYDNEQEEYFIATYKRNFKAFWNIFDDNSCYSSCAPIRYGTFETKKKADRFIQECKKQKNLLETEKTTIDKAIHALQILKIGLNK